MNIIKAGVAGKVITVNCKWCNAPVTDVTTDVCKICDQLHSLLRLRTQAALRMLGSETNIPQVLLAHARGIVILKDGFPEGMYEAFDFSSKETALEVFRNFGNEVREGVAQGVIHGLTKIGLVPATVQDTPTPKEEEKPKLIIEK